MSRNITISLSDAEYAALQAAGAERHQTPEDLAAVAISSQLAPQHATTSHTETGQVHNQEQARETLLAIMRKRGHLAEPASVAHDQLKDTLPPVGSPERVAFEERIGDELSDALERSGLDILDLIERR